MNKIISVLAISALTIPLAQAANYGTDLNNTMLPATGGMGGASVARTIEGAAAVFGNPATLTEYNEGTTFSFGATFYKPQIHDSHNGLDTGVAWSADSKATNYLIPTVAITQAFTPNLVAGLGLTVQSGVGSDFRNVPGSLDPVGELLLFSANLGAAYKVTDNLSLGATATIGDGYFQASISPATASAHNFGIRGTVGAKYDIGATSIGLYYRSPLKIRYDDFISAGVPIGPGRGTFWSNHVAQPQEFAVGLSNNSLMGGNLLLSGDIIYKDWSGAAFYSDFYRDQTIFSLGAQLTTGPAKWRLGYSHARDPILRNVHPCIGGDCILGFGAGIGVPVTSAVVQYFQATNAEAIWENQVSAGFGYQITKNFSADAHAALALSNSQDIGNTHVSAKAWQTGVGLTYSFK